MSQIVKTVMEAKQAVNGECETLMEMLISNNQRYTDYEVETYHSKMQKYLPKNRPPALNALFSEEQWKQMTDCMALEYIEMVSRRDEVKWIMQESCQTFGLTLMFDRVVPIKELALSLIPMLQLGVEHRIDSVEISRRVLFAKTIFNGLLDYHEPFCQELRKISKYGCAPLIALIQKHYLQ